MISILIQTEIGRLCSLECALALTPRKPAEANFWSSPFLKRKYFYLISPTTYKHKQTKQAVNISFLRQQSRLPLMDSIVASSAGIHHENCNNRTSVILLMSPQYRAGMSPVIRHTIGATPFCSPCRV